MCVPVCASSAPGDRWFLQGKETTPSSLVVRPSASPPWKPKKMVPAVVEEARDLEHRGFRIFPLHSMVPREEQETVDLPCDPVGRSERAWCGCISVAGGYRSRMVKKILPLKIGTPSQNSRVACACDPFSVQTCKKQKAEESN